MSLATRGKGLCGPYSHPVARLKIDFENMFLLLFRDISFLYDVKYVKGEAREGVLCPPHSGHSLQTHDGVIVPHKVNNLIISSSSL